MISLNMIPKYDNKSNDKCMIYSLTKITKKHFPLKSVSITNLLQLNNSDVCDMRNTLTRGGKKHFFTFIMTNQSIMLSNAY